MNNTENAKVIQELFEQLPYHLQVEKIQEVERLVYQEATQLKRFQDAMETAGVDSELIEKALTEYRSAS